MEQGVLFFLTFFEAMFSGFKKSVHGLNTLCHLESKILVSHATFSLSTIALVIVEIPALRLVEGCVVSRYNHPAQGDYRLLRVFSECFREVINSIAENRCH